MHLLNQPQAALRLALENWLVQREPADARIFLECAKAGGDLAAAKPVLDWMTTNRVEDLRLTRLIQPIVSKK